MGRFTKILKPLLKIEHLEFSLTPKETEEIGSPDYLERVHYGLIEQTGFKLEKQYDYIIMTEVFEHFASNPVNVMKNIRGLLKENGRIFLSTPNWGPLWIYDSWMEMKPFNEFSSISEYSEHTSITHHIYQYSKSELVEIFNEAGFEILKYELNANNGHCLLLGRA